MYTSVRAYVCVQVRACWLVCICVPAGEGGLT